MGESNIVKVKLKTVRFLLIQQGSNHDHHQPSLLLPWVQFLWNLTAFAYVDQGGRLTLTLNWKDGTTELFLPPPSSTTHNHWDE